ncbi:MAG: 4Fe-4S dicluster domain-containing protein [Coriobacteriales bacterium]|jgi:ferredoxin|nr:4Fe-4S dicluster domain-containing protein [Coriobacteriales bacterium]
MLLKREHLDELLNSLSKRARVYLPARRDDTTTSCFALYQQVGRQAFIDASLSLVNTTMPPKDLLFPQTQKMYRYGVDAEGSAWIDPIHDADAVVVFGLRSCDMRSIECMDDVFLTKGYDDEFYGARRALLTTVAIGCTEVAETCFCDSMGLDPNTAPAADIQLNALTDGSGWLVNAQTERGRAALANWQEYLQQEGEKREPSSPLEPAPSLVRSACTLKVNAEGIKEKLDELYEHPLWDEIAKKCITCGTCTFVCPTCHCFDISQENRMKEGERFRCWDSCMFSAYTEMAGHHNPRASRAARVRQRFMHKLCFFEERYGKSLCVGCGRCVEKCPVALDITVLIDRIAALSAASPAALAASPAPSSAAIEGGVAHGAN